MKNILITGGAGFIGSNFIHYMLRNYLDRRLVNLDALTYAGNLGNLVYADKDPRYTFIIGDINDAKFIENLFRANNFDAVVNFAAESHVDRSINCPGQFVLTNVVGTHNLMVAAKTAWDGRFKETRFIQVSTDEVYGSLGPEGYFTEETPLAPNSPYSASKASADLLARSYFETFGFPVIVTRCSNNYGPYQYPEKLIPLMITNALKNRPLPVYGDGKNIRDWLYVQDHCSAIATVLHKGVPGNVYNIGGNNEKCNIDIVKLICEVLDKPDGLIKFVKDRPGHDRRYAIDSTKIQKELGWSPATTFEQGIRATIDWYVKNEEWSNKIFYSYPVQI